MLTKPLLVLWISPISNSRRWLRSGFGKTTLIAFSPSEVFWVWWGCSFHNDAPGLPVRKEHALKGTLVLLKFLTLKNKQNVSCPPWVLLSVMR